MKAIQFSSENVVRTAVRCMSFDMDEATSFSKGMMAETLKKRMMRGEVVRFCYQKLDGSIRFAIGTLQSDAVKANINGRGISRDSVNCVCYWDCEKGGFRSLRFENLIEVL